MSDILAVESIAEPWATSSSFSPDSVSRLEGLRLEHQAKLDQERTARQRNEDGQFATPPALADDIVRFVLSTRHAASIRFLEPACGSGSFFSALVRQGRSGRIERAVGVERDERFADAARELWMPHGLEVMTSDFLEWSRSSDYRANMLITNPPYVRHHHLQGDFKLSINGEVRQRIGIKVSGLAGLYVYFMLLCHEHLEPGATSAWLIPTEFMDVNYGSALREYLTSRVTLERIHRFDPADVQFDDALVSSSVVVFRNELPARASSATFSYGGSLMAPRQQRDVPIAELQPARKWLVHFSNSDLEDDASVARLGDFFKIRRGIATGSNKLFILPRRTTQEMGFLPEHCKPILPSPRSIPELEIGADESGWPLLEEPMALLDSALPPRELHQRDAPLAAYFDEIEASVSDGYLVSKRSPWYRQEQRDPAPFLCTYMGRGTDTKHPFRFLLNRSRATGTNLFLLMYPTVLMSRYLASGSDAMSLVHQALLSLTPDDLRHGGRVYGGGLHKMEPGELAMLRADAIVRLDSALLTPPATPNQLRFVVAS